MASRRAVIVAALSLAASVAAVGGAGSARAATSHNGKVAGRAGAFICSGGTAAAPQTVPAGTYASLVIGSQATCATDAGPVTVTGFVSVAPGGAFAAAFSSSPLTVDGDVVVNSGAAAFLGCEPNFFPCFDDPNKVGPVTIKGSLVAESALTVVTHAMTVGGDVQFLGGGGGLSCPNEGPGTGTVPGNTPAAAVLNSVPTPPYFDNEDNTVTGNVWITNVQTCWTGSLRNHVGGSLVDENNVMADPDAGEVLANHVSGNLICAANNPATQFGDSMSTSNIVSGFAQGQCAFSVRQPNPAPAGPQQPISVQDPNPQGYVLGGGDGGVFAFGTPFFGSAPGTNELFNFAGIGSSPGGHGYWIVNGSGHVVGFGPNAPFRGDPGGAILNAPMVGIAPSPWGGGYYLAGGDGGVFNFGLGTKFYGSAGGIHLNQPVVGIAASPMGTGYYLVAKDGGVFNYGPSALFHGSLGAMKINAPIVGIAVDPVTGGYWLVGADGGVYSFGAPFFGSLGAMHLNQPVVGMVAAPGGNGYYLVAADGGVFALGPGARYQGGTGGIHLNQPVTGMSLG
jgi:hypothetical protein